MSQRQELQLQGQEYRNFIHAIHSDETKRIYVRALKHYMRFLKINKISFLLGKDSKTLEQQIIFVFSQHERTAAVLFYVNFIRSMT